MGTKTQWLWPFPSLKYGMTSRNVVSVTWGRVMKRKKGSKLQNNDICVQMKGELSPFSPQFNYRPLQCGPENNRTLKQWHVASKLYMFCVWLSSVWCIGCQPWSIWHFFFPSSKMFGQFSRLWVGVPNCISPTSLTSTKKSPKTPTKKNVFPSPPPPRTRLHCSIR